MAGHLARSILIMVMRAFLCLSEASLIHRMIYLVQVTLSFSLPQQGAAHSAYDDFYVGTLRSESRWVRRNYLWNSEVVALIRRCSAVTHWHSNDRIARLWPDCETFLWRHRHLTDLAPGKICLLFRNGKRAERKLQRVEMSLCSIQTLLVKLLCLRGFFKLLKVPESTWHNGEPVLE